MKIKVFKSQMQHRNILIVNSRYYTSSSTVIQTIFQSCMDESKNNYNFSHILYDFKFE